MYTLTVCAYTCKKMKACELLFIFLVAFRRNAKTSLGSLILIQNELSPFPTLAALPCAVGGAVVRTLVGTKVVQ